MDELIRQGLSILRGMWQRRWIGLVVAWVVGIGAAIAVLQIPPQYEATARIFVDTQSVLKPLMSGIAVQPNVNQQIMMLSRTLISRPNMEKLIRIADLDLRVQTKEQQEATISLLTKNLRIGSTGRDNLYTLSYRDTEPERARRVVQGLASIFVESSLGDKRQDSTSAKKFLDDQIASYAKKLAEAEDRLQAFKIRNIGLTGTDGKDYFSRMAEASSALANAKLELREAENSRNALRKQLAGEEPIMLPETVETAQVATVTEIDGRIDALKRNLDTLMQRYTNQHPDVVGAKRVIEQLEQQKQKELAARPKSTGGPAASPNTNPVYQQLRVSLSAVEATVASLQTRVAEFESRHQHLKEGAKLVPQIETEFAQLNRDYGVHKRNYEQLVARRESAEMAGEMEAAASLADFRLIDPPRVGPQPVAPNRLLLFTLALVGSLAVGAFASLAASQIRPTILDTRSLREVSGLPVLGTVSMIVSEPMKRREQRGILTWIAGFVALVGSYIAGIAVLSFLITRAA